ncbi:TonB-dependent receptor [Chitinophaga pinensis]|uniref:TonB-dependent siderophore receptor n=1 Tax=Chitinophaga pinensis (strain ATCC 43595 / DSM 2588 / LMG 13176 / NBRC 15968 / NCIMB 11800 / UQM 2034) TaxID=485918 RepID=A0A979G8W6_CHIPD|nr:TonB-dependent receptor [Chitinophaga pinensis]ACU63104.1 TonB-dependent siderophore receptor [Chitinophaga pinensis DSM 2588]
MNLNTPKSILIAFSILLSGFASFAQNSVIRGEVKTADGKPAAFVNIFLQPSGAHTTVDQTGHYEINNVKPGKHIVVASFTGLKIQQQEADLLAGQPLIINFTLQEDNRTLQEVNVTSGYNKFARKETENVARMPLLNLENPQVYHVVPKELLQDQVIISYNDVLKNVTGVSQALVNGSNSFNLRGFFTTSYLRNGLQDNKANSIEVTNIERIEVLKGPSATLFGSSLVSFGGLLNRVTKKPFETFSGEVTYTTGGFGLNRVSADFNTPLNKEKGLLLRTNVAYHDERSYQDAGFTKRFFFAPSLLYKVNDRLTVLLDAEIYTQKANDFNRMFPEASFAKTNPRDLNFDWLRSYSSNDLYETSPSVSLFGAVNYQLSDHWKSQTSFSRTSADVEGYWSWNSIVGDSLVSRNPGYQQTNYDYTEVQQNFNGDFSIGRLRNRVVIGLDYFTNTTTSSSASIYGFDEVYIHQADPRYNELTVPALQQAFSAIPYAKSRSKQSAYSAYFSDVLNITDNLLVMASLRVDHFVNGGTYNINLDTTTGKYNQTTLSPKLGLVYQLIPKQLAVFGNYMNGFSNNAPVRQPDGTFTSFKPSRANQWEGGVKLELFNGKVNSTLSYYHIKVDDMIHNSFDPEKAGFQVQDGGQLSKGFEAEVIANPIQGLNIIAGYAYNDIYTINTDPDADGLHQWTGPAHMANLWLSYHLFNTALKGLGIGVGGNYNGKAYIQQSRSQGEFYLPSYKVLNAVLSYEHSVYRISCKLDNLTNEVYWGSYVSRMMPRRFSATVTFKFR